MKTNITISIDIEIAEELKKEKNQSALINSYLRNYFNLGNDIKTDDDLKKALEDDQLKKEMEDAF